MTITQIKARNLWLQTTLDRDQIAAILHISKRTLNYWISTYQWNKLRNSATLPEHLEIECLQLLTEVTRQFAAAGAPMPSASDLLPYLKMLDKVQQLRNRAQLHAGLDVLSLFIKDIAATQPILVSMLAPQMEAFLQRHAPHLSMRSSEKFL